jgi:hypothetical protein
MSVVRPDPAIRDAVARFGAPALAWEVLRRDPAYRHAIAGGGVGIAGVAAEPGFAARWGVHFP